MPNGGGGRRIHNKPQHNQISVSLRPRPNDRVELTLVLDEWSRDDIENVVSALGNSTLKAREIARRVLSALHPV